MTFLSLPFFVFFPAVVLGYHLLPRSCKAGWLLLASWFFYLCAGAEYAPFLLAVILFSYGEGRLMERGPRRWAVVGTVALCAGMLFVFKYLNFACSLAAGVLSAAGLSVSAPVFDLILPAGISFYLFEAMGYVIDVYRGKLPAQRNLLRHALFLSFFPQLLSGPIARAPQLLPQLEALPPVTWDTLRGGLFRFLWGAFKKLVLADRLAILVQTVFAAPGEFGRVQILMAAAAFSLQIYCDFSAYSDMAVGTAKAMGFTLIENFRAPYLARSIQEFWRRWHISLSTWFRDYLYFPLGGSHRGKVRTWVNILIVFAVSGLWHGAGLTYLVWGLLNGAYQVAGSITAPARRRVRAAVGLKEDGALTVWLQRGITFVLATGAWVFFQAATLETAGQMYAGLLSGPLWVFASIGLDRWDLLVALAGLLLLFAADLLEQKRPLTERWLALPAAGRWAAALALVLLTVVFGCYGPGYDAQSFIYFQY